MPLFVAILIYHHHFTFIILFRTQTIKKTLTGFENLSGLLGGLLGQNLHNHKSFSNNITFGFKAQHIHAGIDMAGIDLGFAAVEDSG